MKSQPQFRPAAIPRRPLTCLCAALALAAIPALPALAQAPPSPTISSGSA